MSLDQLIINNKKWALNQSSKFFERLVDGQNPSVLWIGCSDSRVPPDTITQMEPGNIFVHRNIANLINENDLNLISVLEYAINVLKIKHIIVCGHYGCGGIQAAFENTSLGKIDKWIEPIKKLIGLNKKEIDSYKDQNSKLKRIVEINILDQVKKLKDLDLVKNGKKENINFLIHPVVFDFQNGRLNLL
tara:strand:- start:645 stop:1211 length:567 start_codon:yes stop_codon:yes gene_type:complete